MNALPPRKLASRGRRRLARIPAVNFLRYAASGRVPWQLALRGAPRSLGFRLPTDFDAEIFRALIISDEYRLHRQRFDPSDVVVDIGGHHGCFGLLCHLLESRRIVSYEAHAGNATILARNYRRLRGAQSVFGAVTRSDVPVERMRHSGFAGNNTGGGNVLFGGRTFDLNRQAIWAAMEENENSEDTVPVLPLDSILLEHRRVRLLKLDCEVSEFPILLTSQRLDTIDEIVGEYHEVTEAAYRQLDPSAQIAGHASYRIADLVDRLNRFGFRVRTKSTGRWMGLFWARRE